MLVLVPVALICWGVDSGPPSILWCCQHVGSGRTFISFLLLNLPWNRRRTASNLWLEASPHFPLLPTSCPLSRPLSLKCVRASSPSPLAEGEHRTQVQKESCRYFCDYCVVKGGKGSTWARLRIHPFQAPGFLLPPSL